MTRQDVGMHQDHGSREQEAQQVEIVGFQSVVHAVVPFIGIRVSCLQDAPATAMFTGRQGEFAVSPG